MLFKKLSLITVLLVAAIACKEDDSDIEPEVMHVGEVTPKGTALGDAESFSIGPDGGVIAFGDGVIEVNIPAGALATSTTIQVESVENTCSAGIGSSFRFTPHDLEFAKPVTVTFNYENIPVSLDDGLAIAYQKDDGIWYWPGNHTRDKNQKTVSVQTTHFSDWTLFESMHLAPGRANVDPNEELGLMALRYLPENDISKLLTPLVQTSDPVSLGEAVHLEQKYIKEWTLIGDGILTPSGSTATYLAPANIPDDNPVTVSLEINLKNGSKAFLLSYITVGTTQITFNGGPYSNLTMAANNPGSGAYVAAENVSFVMFSGLDDNGNAIAVQIFFPGKEKGQFAWNDKCFAVTNHNIGAAIVAGNSFIPSDPPSVHPGHVKITEYGEVGGSITGTFEGNFTFTDFRCQPPCMKYGSIKGMFTVPRFK